MALHSTLSNTVNKIVRITENTQHISKKKNKNNSSHI